MKIIYATDPHIKGRNHGARLDDFPAAIMKKMLELEQVCYYEQPEALVIGGDLYDTPRVAFSLIIAYARIFRRLKKKGIRVLLVPGNHDFFGYNMDTLDQTAIGVLAEAGLIELLTREKSYLLKDDKGVTVEVFGREYDKDIDTDYTTDYEINPKHNARWNILFAHGMILDKPFHPNVRHSLTKDIETQAHMVVCGHYHPGYPVHEENGVIFANPGSMGRDEICNRIPQYAIIEAKKKRLNIEYVEFASAADPKDIFDFSIKQQNKAHERYLEAFEQTIQDAMTFDAYDPKDVLNELAAQQQIEQAIIQEVEEAIIAAEKVVQDGKLDGYIEKKRPIAITEIEIENFQSHAHTKIEFNQRGLNAITGASDSGKSAIIRALRWVFYNEPKGNEFIRHGQSRASVTVRFSDGSFLTRTRTNSDAGSYVVGFPDGTTREFKGFANALPIDIANIHQMPKVELAPGYERPLNFSFQLDGHFLLAESAAIRAATIGRLTGVHVVDHAIKEKRKELLNLTKDLNASEKRIDDLNARIDGYSDIEGLKQQIDLATVILNGIEKTEKEIEELYEMKGQINGASNDVIVLEKQLEEYKDLPKAQKMLEKAEKIGDELRDLEELRDELVDTTKTIRKLEERHKQFDRLTYAEQDILKLEESINELKDLQELADELNECDAAIQSLESQASAYKRVEEAVNKLDQMDRLWAEILDLQELLGEIESANLNIKSLEENLTFQQERKKAANLRMKEIFAKMGNKCPTCQQDLDEAHMEHVMEAI